MPAIYSFDDLTLDAGRYVVERNEEQLTLPKLSYELLLLLVERSPNVVTQEEILAHVWAGFVVSQEAVKQRVKLLRDGLGDDAANPRYIQLVRGRGYRLIPSVDVTQRPLGIDPRFRGRRRLIVAAAIVVTVVFWLFQYEVREYRSTETTAERTATTSAEAYEFYTRGRASTEIDWPTALEYYDRAIELDPGFALAHAYKSAALGLAVSGRRGIDHAKERSELMELADAHARQAIATDPNLGRGYLALGFINGLEGCIDEAEKYFRRALVLAPNDAGSWRGYSYLKRRLNDFDGVWGSLGRAAILDPNSRDTRELSAEAYWLTGNLDQASREIQEVVALNPMMARNRAIYGVIETLRGNSTVANEQLRIAEQDARIDRLRVITLIAYGYQRLGRSADADRMLNEFGEIAQTRRVGSGYRALASLVNGDVTTTLHWLERSAATTSADHDELIVLLLRSNAFQDPVLDRQEFVDVRRRLLRSSEEPGE